MSGIHLGLAQAQLDALFAAQMSNQLSVSIAGRSVSFRSTEDLTAAINYWARIVAGLKRQAAGESRHGFAAANFQNTR